MSIIQKLLFNKPYRKQLKHVFSTSILNEAESIEVVDNYWLNADNIIYLVNMGFNYGDVIDVLYETDILTTCKDMQNDTAVIKQRYGGYNLGLKVALINYLNEK